MSTEEETKKEEETKAEEGGEEASPETAECDAHFQPVVSTIMNGHPSSTARRILVQLEEVEVVSGEEEEEVLFTQRSKLFIFGETLLDKGTGNKQWRERGVGEMKILQHKENKKCRVLMRQEKTMKIICNHIIDPRIEILPQMSSDKAWMWSAFDFADGELVETIFALRFGNSEIANDFKAKFEECQKMMKGILDTEGDAPEDAEAAAAADDAAAKLSELKTSD
eukprot:scaffold1581_cov169-Amphora_coffeaeformis.AAC.17